MVKIEYWILNIEYEYVHERIPNNNRKWKIKNNFLLLNYFPFLCSVAWLHGAPHHSRCGLHIQHNFHFCFVCRSFANSFRHSIFAWLGCSTATATVAVCRLMFAHSIVQILILYFVCCEPPSPHSYPSSTYSHNGGTKICSFSLSLLISLRRFFLTSKSNTVVCESWIYDYNNRAKGGRDKRRIETEQKNTRLMKLVFGI